MSASHRERSLGEATRQLSYFLKKIVILTTLEFSVVFAFIMMQKSNNGCLKEFEGCCVEFSSLKILIGLSCQILIKLQTSK